MGIFNRLFHHSPKYYLIPACIGFLVAGLALLRESVRARMQYVNALTVAGALVILLGLLGLVIHLGAFDVFGYSFSTLGARRRYKSLYDYGQAKQEQRSRSEWIFVPYFVVGAVFLAAGLILWL